MDGNCYAIDGWGAVDGIFYPNHYLIKRLLNYESIKKKGSSCDTNSFCKTGICVKANATSLLALDDHECSQDQFCQNGGQCIQISQFYVCLCKDGYTGSNCEFTISS